jgi:hypothetical protein
VRVRILCAVFILFGLASCSSPSQPSSLPQLPATHVVSGQITDLVTGAPLPGRQLRFGPQHIVTDANGRYSIEIASGDYSFGLDSGEAGWISARYSPTNGDVFANIGNCQGRYGVVFDLSTGRPIAAAQVSLTRDATTSADGWYRVDAGCGQTFFNTTFFQANAPGYEAYSQPMGRYVNSLTRQDIGLKPLH